MSFWSTETIKDRASREKLIEPYSGSRIKSSAYELSVGREAFITSDQSGNKIQLEIKNNILRIPPGQLALLITDEVVKIPSDTIGFISIRASIKFNGLVNVSGFHVDPGYHGRLKFTVYNAGSQDIYLSPGDAVFPMWFCSLDQTTSLPYGGEHQGQMEISSKDIMRLSGDIASPAALKTRLDELERDFAQKNEQLERELESRHKDLQLDYEKRMHDHEKRVHALETTWFVLRGTILALFGAALLAALTFASQIFIVSQKIATLPTNNPGATNSATHTHTAPNSSTPPPTPVPAVDAGTK
jgi:dCTP deaminase